MIKSDFLASLKNIRINSTFKAVMLKRGKNNIKITKTGFKPDYALGLRDEG
jgi:hypothetical protein